MIESLVRDGNKIIFGTSFGFQPCMVSEAKKHSEQNWRKVFAGLKQLVETGQVSQATA